MESLDKGLSSEGIVLSHDGRRLSKEKQNFNLSNFLVFSVVRGAEDSAPAESLNFSVSTIGLENSLLGF